MMNKQNFSKLFPKTLRVSQKSKQETQIDWSQLKEIQIMGDWFYNSNRKLSEYRVLAISPVPMDSNIKQIWYYYPDIRSTLAKLQVESENPMIHNLDDIFYFGEYPYLIYKVENMEDTAFEKSKLADETQKILQENLMIEAAYWNTEK